MFKNIVTMMMVIRAKNDFKKIDNQWLDFYKKEKDLHQRETIKYFVDFESKADEMFNTFLHKYGKNRYSDERICLILIQEYQRLLSSISTSKRRKANFITL